MKSSNLPLAAGACPLCSQPSQCGLEKWKISGQPCWCASIQADEAALRRVPEEARGKTCLCRRCLEKDD